MNNDNDQFGLEIIGIPGRDECTVRINRPVPFKVAQEIARLFIEHGLDAPRKDAKLNTSEFARAMLRTLKNRGSAHDH